MAYQTLEQDNNTLLAWLLAQEIPLNVVAQPQLESPTPEITAALLTEALNYSGLDDPYSQLKPQSSQRAERLASPGEVKTQASIETFPLSSAEMEKLRELVLIAERQRLAKLEAQVSQLQRQLDSDDSEEMIAIFKPVIAEIIAARVRESQDDVAEALYPVIGKSVRRAVAQAIRDLARGVDAAMRRSLYPQPVRKLMQRMRGIDSEDAALRDLLPFQVHEIFLIHQESGLLIHHLSAVGTLSDADLIAGMLSAIRSYVQESFAPGTEGTLEEIRYGDLRILMVEGSVASLAVVLQGTEPAGFQSLLLEQVSNLHNAYGRSLRAFDGNPLNASKILPFLKPLLEV